MSTRCGRAAALTSIAVVLGLAAAPAPAHNNTIVHRGMGQWSATILNDPFYTPYIWEVGEGSDKEDVPPTRSLGHFYNPETDSAPWFALGAGPATQNAQNQYNAALAEYFAGNLVGTDAAFHRMGRALHFIQDMTSPAHTHDDQHATDDEDFEDWGPSHFPPMDFSWVTPKFAADPTAAGFVRELGRLIYDATAYQCDIDENTGPQPDSEYKRMFPSLHWEDGGLFGDDVWEVDNIGTFDCFGNGVFCNDGWWMIDETLIEDNSGRGGSRRLRGFAYVENTGGTAAEPVPLVFNGLTNSANETLLQLYGRLFYPEAIAYGAGLLAVFRDEVRPPTPTDTVTDTPTRTPTVTRTLTRTATGTMTASRTATPTRTSTRTTTATRTPTVTPTPTGTSTATFTPTSTPVATATSSWTATPIPTATRTATGTPTATGTRTFSASPTPPVSGTPTPTETPAMLCGATPRPACRGAARTMIKLQFGAALAQNRFFWKWSGGEATSMQDLGDPTVNTAYALCTYGSAGGVPQLLSRVEIAPASACGFEFCWRRSGDKGYRYKDPIGSNGGLRKLLLKSGAAGKAKLIVKSAGERIPLPPAPVPQDPAVVVQLVNSDGRCWDASYAAPPVQNDLRAFRDRTP